jgi:iron-sulfur cluster assembly accessory protein|tara:strand:- start:61 stop:366 length:306 start_codon:yes stop_codon:yes gene_type:complete
MEITQSAENKINQTLSAEEFLRVEVNGGGCSGFTVGLSKTDGAKENDIWLNGNLVIDSISAEYLSKATLDWIDDPFSPSFNFKIPNTKSCGCGNSFTLEEN